MTTEKQRLTHDFSFTKNSLYLYTFSIGLGSVALFAFLIGGYTTIQAIVWKYSMKYILNSAVLSLVGFVSGVLLIGSCWLLVKKNEQAKNANFLGCSLLIVYPFVVFTLSQTMPYSFPYVAVLCLPAFILLIISLALGKRIWHG